MSEVNHINSKLKRLFESKKLEKKRVGWLNTKINLKPASFLSVKPTDAKTDETFYHFYFHSKPTKKYFVAKELAKKARLHKILKNDFDDDETINHLAIFSSDQKDEIFLMNDLLSSRAANIGIYGYAIYGVHIYSIMTHCKERLEGSYLRYDDMAHFMGCMVQREKNEREIEIAKNVGNLLKERYGFSKGIALGHYLRFRYMYGMHEHYLKISCYFAEKIDKIPGSKTKTDKFIETINHKKEKRKEVINKIYTELIEKGEITAKWVSEWALYELIKKKFPDAIYQYRSPWLGNQSLDIYVPSEKLGFEYQGIQHFKPVDFFGGEKAFKHRVYLDELKKAKAASEDIIIIYWDYMEPLSVAVLNEKLNQLSP